MSASIANSMLKPALIGASTQAPPPLPGFLNQEIFFANQVTLAMSG